MHIPDGFLSPPVALTTGAISALGVGGALSRLKPESEPGLVPRMGLTAAYVFGAQMVNFPVAGGTSGHLLGGLLAALLLGPTAATVVMAAVFLIQAFFFLDGGHTTLGANVLNMGLAGTFGGYAVYRVVAGSRPEMKRCLAASAAGAWTAVMLGAVLTSLELALSGRVPARIVFPAMLGVHAVIGLGEAVITAATVALLWRVRPDLLTAREQAGPASRNWGWAAGAGLAAVALLAPLKSDFPDGLEWVAGRLGFMSRETAPLFGGPMPGYELPGLGGSRWAAVIVSLIGAALVLGLLQILGRLTRVAGPDFHRSRGRIDGRVQLAALFALVISAALVPPLPALRLWVLFLIALVWAALAQVSGGWVARRGLLLLPLLLFVVIGLPFAHDQGTALVVSLLLRAGTSLLATAAFAHSVPESDALTAMYAFRFPRALVDTVAFALRYARLIGEDSRRMLRARAARSAGSGTLALRTGATGGIVGSLFIRSFERSECLSQAMAARGFAGSLPNAASARLSRQDRALACGIAAVMVGVWLWR